MYTRRFSLTIPIGALLLVAWFSLFASAQSTDLLTRGIAALKPEIIVVAEPHRSTRDAATTIFVIGENHASVKVQLQVAESLNALLNAGLIDGILVEGSPYGPIGRGEFAAKAKQLDLDGYWRRELELGNLSGADYVGLSRPQVPYYGIEDMAAKKRFEDDTAVSTNQWVLQWQVESAARAVPLFEKALQELQSKLSPLELMPVLTQLREYRDVVNGQQRALKTTREQDAELQKLETRLDSIIPIIVKYQAAAKAKNAAQLATLERQLSQVMISSNYNQTQLQSDLQRLGDLRSSADAAQEAMASFETRARDEYFVMANALRAGGLRFSEIETFLADEADRFHAATDSIYTKSDFLGRDRAMVANARKYLNTSGHKSVAMIVGYAHLEDLTDLLMAEDVNFVTAMLAANRDNIEPWEGDSWERRSKGGTQIFSSSLPRLKETSHLLDATWKRERQAVIQYFEGPQFATQKAKAPTSIPAHAYDVLGLNITKRLWVWNNTFSAADKFGSHVVTFGAIPGDPDKFFQVYDRAAAQKLVKDLSDTETAFGYYYRTGNTYRIQGPAGLPLSVAALRARPLSISDSAPTKSKRVVLFGEPDLSLENGLAMEPFWKLIRSRDAVPNRAGLRSSNPTSWTTAGAKQGQGQKIGLYRTTDADSAQRRLSAIDKEKPIGGVQITTQGKIDDLWFTPSKGDYAQAVVIVEQHTNEFMKSLAAAAKAGKFRNKQIALVTCGDAFTETQRLKDVLLNNGALMVWVPDRQIPVKIGNDLAVRIADFGKAATPGEAPQTIDGLISGALEQWESEDPRPDADWSLFETAPTWVRNIPISRNLYELLRALTMVDSSSPQA